MKTLHKLILSVGLCAGNTILSSISWTPGHAWLTSLSIVTGIAAVVFFGLAYLYLWEFTDEV